MITRGIKKRISYFLAICMVLMNFSFGYAEPVVDQYNNEQPNLKYSQNNLSVTEAAYTTLTKSTVASSIYSAASTAPVSLLTPINSWPSITSTPSSTTTTQTPAPSAYNDDYGNNMLSAHPINEKTNINGTIETTADVDVFSISSKLDCDIIVNLSYTSSVNISILDYSGNKIESTTTVDTNDNNETIVITKFHALKDMKYYLKLVCWNQGGTNYSFHYEYLVDDYSDTFTGASNISLGETINGNLINDKDIDTFKCTVPKDGVYTLDYLKSKCSLSIYDEKNVKQNIINNFVQLKGSQVYYIKTEKNSNYPNTFYYDFKINGPVSDDYGDSKEKSTEIKTDDVVTGSIDHSIDKDLFSFTPPETGSYVIYGLCKTADGKSTQIDIYNRTCLDIYDSRGAKVGPYTNSNDLTYALNKNATYYISFSTGEYSTTLYKYSFKIIYKLPGDNDNSFDTAREIDLNEIVKGSITPLGDTDCFIFKPSAEGAYCINFKSQLVDFGDINDLPNPQLTHAVRVYDDEGTHLGYGDYYDASRAYFYFDENKSYYITISNLYYSPIFSYTFNIEGPAADDFANKKEFAAQIQVNQKVEGIENYFNDVDYFAFKPEIDGTYYIEDYSEDNNQQNIWQVYDSTSNIIHTLTNDHRRINFIASKDNIYYISFMRGTYKPATGYSFMVKGPMDDDFGNTIDNAKELQLNTPVTVISNYYGDNDFLSFSPSEDGLYYFDLASSKDLNAFQNSLYIYDSNNNWLYYKVIDSKLYITLSKDTSYFICFKGETYEMVYPASYSFTFNGPLKDDYADTKESAHAVELIKKIEGISHSSQDKDYFTFKSQADGIYRLDFTCSSNKYLSSFISIFDAYGNRINIKHSETIAFFEFKKDNVYYLVANDPTDHSLLKYSFTLSGPVVDDYGNSKEKSFVIRTGDEVKGQINYFNDEDYFKFTPSISGAYSLNNISIDNTGENYYMLPYYLLRITDSNGFRVDFESLNDNEVSCSLYKDTTYYIYFTTSSDRLYNYTFALKGPLPDDFGNTLSYAETIKPGQKVQGMLNSLNDKDIFSFTTNSKSIYCISVSDNVNLHLTNNSQYISQSPVNLDSKDHYYYLPANETYYIAIDAKENMPRNYTLELKVPIFDDYANTYDDGTVVKIDTPTKGAVNYPGDIDMLQIIPQNTGYMYFKFDAPSNLKFKILNSNDIDLISSNNNTNIYSINIKDQNILKLQIDSLDVLLMGEYTLTVSDSPETLLTVKESAINSSDTVINPPAPSDVDDYGNNILEAYQIYEKTAVSGKLEPYLDNDVFSLTSKSDDYIAFEISHSGEIIPCILDYRGKEIEITKFQHNYEQTEHKTVVKFKAAKNMKYFLKLYGYNMNLVEYSFNYAYLVDDYSNYQVDSTDITAGYKISGNLVDDEDMDVFKFAPKQSGIYKFEYAKYKCDVTVTDENNNKIFIIDGFALLNSNKTYYITVQKNIFYTNTYFYDFEILGPIKDDLGDSTESAKQISFDTEISGSMDHSTDKDYFSFNAPNSGVYQISGFSTSYSPYPFFDSYLNNCIKVYDSTGNAIEFDRTYSNYAFFSLIEGQTYYILLSNVTSNSLLFTYSFKLKPPTPDDVGNSIESAKEIQQNTVIEGTTNNYCDADYFMFKPSASGEYCINFSMVFDGTNYYKPNLGSILHLYDKNGNRLFNSTYAGSSKAYAYLQKDQNYYFAVTGIDTCPFFDYSFYVEGPMIDDYSNTKESAEQIKTGQLVEGIGNFYNDHDYFSFKPSYDGVYCLIENSSVEFPSQWAVCDSSDNELISSNFYANNFNAKKDEIYYVRFVKNNNDPSPNYSFSIKGPVEDDYGNSKDLAEELQFDVPTTVVTNYTFDNDFLKLIPTEDGLYYFDLVSNNNITRLLDQIRINDSEGFSVNSFVADSKLYVNLIKNKTYYLIIPGYFYPDEYSFTLKGPKADEYGNTKESACEVQLSQKVKGMIDTSNDDDYFSFKSLKAGMYKLDFITSNNFINIIRLPQVFHIYDVYGNSIPLEIIESSAYFCLEQDTQYYFNIFNSPVYYNSFDYSFVVTGPVSDDYGNSADLSQEIVLNNEIKGAINYASDYDYFKYSPSTSGIYYISNLPINRIDSYGIIRITDSSGNPINFGIENTVSPNVYFNLSKNDTYYICLTNSSTKKTFDYSFVLKGPLPDDFGNTPTYSKAVEIGKKVECKFDYTNDVDCMSFTADSNGLYRIWTSGNASIEVYDSTNKKINRFPVNISNYAYYYLKANETYYVKAINTGFNLDSYTVNIDMPVPEDFSNTTDGITTLKVNTPVSGRINYPRDIDMFQFIAQDVGNFYIKFDAPGYLSLEISNSNNIMNYTYLKDNVIAFNSGDYKVFTIGVSSYDAALTGDYSITVSDRPESFIDAACKIKGYISPEYIANSNNPSKAGFTVTVKGTDLSAVTDENGYFEISDVPLSSTKEYDITIAKKGYLKRDISGILVDKDVMISDARAPIVIWSGDLNTPQDDKINMLDVISLSKVFNSVKGDGIYNESADINGDSVINIMDVIIIAKHFNETSDDYPQIDTI